MQKDDLWPRENTTQAHVVKVNFARCLQNMRKTRGMSQKQLAANMGIFQSAVARYESGRAMPSIYVAYLFMKALSAEFKIEPDGMTMQGTRVPWADWMPLQDS